MLWLACLNEKLLVNSVCLQMCSKTVSKLWQFAVDELELGSK